MTNAKTTRKALLSSVVALMLCFTMLMGTTFAWFTDSVSSVGNTIQAGTLKVDLVDVDGNSLEGKTIAFKTADDRTTDILWEPGCTYVTEEFKVVNNGTLALKYQIAVNGIVGDAKLLEAIEWTLTIDGVEYDNTEATLAPGAMSGVIVLEGHMKEEAGNEYQDLTAEGIGITVVATQATVEEDSFDNQYDKDATYVFTSTPVTVPANATEPIVLSKNGTEVEVPAAVVNSLDASVTSISLEYTEPVTSGNTISFESVELVDQNGNVIDLEGNTEKLTVTLPAQTTFAAGETVHIYHDGEYLVDATVNEDTTITYEADHFCEVVATTVSGKVSYRAYVLNTWRKAIQIDMENINAHESLVIELWHEDVLLTTTTYAGSYPFVNPGYTTACVAIQGGFASWDTEISEGVVLSADNIPDTIKVYADGILTNTFTHKSGTVLADKVNDYLAIISPENE